MNNKIITKNNYAFIDGNNLYLGIKEQGWRLDYRKFRIFLKDKFNVDKAFLFIGYVPGNEKMYANFQKFGYICIFKPTLEIKDSKIKKIKGNVDAELVLHSMIEYDNYDKAVLVTSDGDFYCLVEYLVSKNKFLKLLVPSKKYSSLFRKFSRYIDNLSLYRSKIEFK